MAAPQQLRHFVRLERRQLRRVYTADLHLAEHRTVLLALDALIISAAGRNIPRGGGDIFNRSAQCDGFRAGGRFSRCADAGAGVFPAVLSGVCSGKKSDAQGDDGGVEKVVEQTADHRDHKVSRGRGSVAAGDRLHIRHRVGGRAHAEADEARGDHRGVIIAAHEREEDEDGEEHHQKDLSGKADKHRQRQIHELPELETGERHGKEDGEEHIAHRADLGGV